MGARWQHVVRLAALLSLAAFAGGTPAVRSEEKPGWKPHVIKQGNGRGGWELRSGECRFLHRPGGKYTMPFGLTQMDNGEVILAATWHPGKEEKPATPGNFPEKPMVTFSRDRGNTWTDFTPIPGGVGRPVMLTYLGKGELTFQTDGMNPVTQFFSKDYGKTWPDPKPLQPAANKGTHVDGKLQPGYWGAEGNNHVDRDAKGVATRVWQIGWNYDPGTSHPIAPANGLLRWSADGGRTWSKETRPDAWRWRCLRRTFDLRRSSPAARSTTRSPRSPPQVAPRTRCCICWHSREPRVSSSTSTTSTASAGGLRCCAI